MTFWDRPQSARVEPAANDGAAPEPATVQGDTPAGETASPGFTVDCGPSRHEPNGDELPTMADLDALSRELDAVDATLVALDSRAPEAASSDAEPLADTESLPDAEPTPDDSPAADGSYPRIP